MNKIFTYFWMFLVFYFIFVHPAVTYYVYSYPNTHLEADDPQKGLLYFTLSAILWLSVFCSGLYLLMKYTVFSQKRIREIRTNGTRLPAQVIDVKRSKTGRQRKESKHLSLEFDNLQGETVHQTVVLNDSGVEKKSYEVNETVYLKVDETFEKPPYFVLEDNTCPKIKWQPFALWIAFLIGVLFYYNYSYDLENAGYGWCFLTLEHPLISSAGTIILFAVVFYLAFKFIISKNLTIGKESVILKFRGRKAIAKIIQAKQTGTYINEQPKMKFTITFEDKEGVVHQTTIKKIVKQSELYQFVNGAEIAIFYDPENTDSALFEDDVIF